MQIDAGSLGLLVAVFLASLVEFVEAFTIVLAMGMTRGWRSTITGVLVAVGALVLVTLIAGYALVNLVPESLLQLIIGALLLIFGLQWLRKAILRASGWKALHDENEIFREERAAADRAGHDMKAGLDWFAFVVSFKGVFLEGLEVVFIVVTFGLNADNVPLAAVGAAAAGIVVLLVGSLLHSPLSRVPENQLKFAVGILLSTFGTFWAVEGLGIFAEGQGSIEWPGSDWALLGVLITWILVSMMLVSVLKKRRVAPRALDADAAKEQV